MNASVGSDPRGEGRLREGVARASLQRVLFGRAPPVQLGRYEIRGQIGSGGMGVVYRAHDPHLDREVAIKVIRSDAGHDDSAHAQASLLREACALATLAHPNVVAVFDSGIASNSGGGLDETYIVTELVEGASLDQWLGAARRSVAEIRRVFAQAGRGLIAAHDAGLVHRDFKLANVLVGSDGRARVCDFGLVARLRTGAASTPLDRTHKSSSASGRANASGSRPSGEQSLTGTLAGTPGYIAPELQLGERASVASDQYAYCVALYRALFGRHPFPSKGREARDRGNATDSSADPGPVIPRALRAAIERGLSTHPRDRWELLGDLVAIVEGRPKRRTSRTLFAGLAIVAVASISFSMGPEATVCNADEHLASVWASARRAEVLERLASFDALDAATIAERVTAVLDDYAAEWKEGFDQACAAVASATKADSTAADARVQCFEDRLGELDALVKTLPRASAESLPYVQAAARNLGSTQQCDELELDRWVAADESEARLAAETRDLLASARAFVDVHDDASAESTLREAVARSESLPSAPVHFEARVEFGRLRARQGHHDEASALLEATYFDALALERADQANSAALARLSVARTSGELEEGRQWARHARSTLAEPDEQSARRVRLERTRGLIELRHGDVDAGTEALQLALALALQVHEPSHEEVSECRHGVAEALMQRGRYREALDEATRGLDAATAALGEAHPLTIDLRITAALGLAELGDAERARDELAAALALQESTFGKESVEVARALTNLAGVEIALLHYDAAHEQLERALKLRAQFLGADNPRTLFVEHQLAILAGKRNEVDDACRRFQSIIDATQRRVGPDHRDLAGLYYHLGLAHSAANRNERALAAAQESQRILELHFGNEHVNLVHPLRLMTLTDPDPKAALAHAQRAVALLSTTEIPQSTASDVHAVLAFAMQRAGESPQAVDASAERAFAACHDPDCLAFIARVLPEHYAAHQAAAPH